MLHHGKPCNPVTGVIEITTFSHTPTESFCEHQLDVFVGLKRGLNEEGVRVNNWHHFTEWLAPADRGSYIPWWSFLFTAAVCFVFFYMAGECTQ